MHRPQRLLQILVLSLAVGAFASSCGSKSEEVANTPPPTMSTISVASVDLGRGVGEDKRVTDATQTFSPNDVIYASIQTRGASAGASLMVKWTSADGQVIDQSERTIAPDQDAATEFHIAKADGWPAGKYKLEVFLDQTSAQVREFEVKAS